MIKRNLYSICVIDVGSPKLGNLGWCFYNSINDKTYTGENLTNLYPLILENLSKASLIFGLEAPLFVPIRDDLILATKARKGEGRRPWSAGAGAQVLALNLPIMVHIFSNLYKINKAIDFVFVEEGFTMPSNQILLFEALVSGQDKGNSHVNDAEIMVESCKKYQKLNLLPKTILEFEDGVTYFNLAASALYNSGYKKFVDKINSKMPIYRPD